jgi:hypothetical protein
MTSQQRLAEFIAKLSLPEEQKVFMIRGAYKLSDIEAEALEQNLLATIHLARETVENLEKIPPAPETIESTQRRRRIPQPVDLSSCLKILRSNWPELLPGYTDDDLIERMRVVYSGPARSSPTPYSFRRVMTGEIPAHAGFINALHRASGLADEGFPPDVWLLPPTEFGAALRNRMDTRSDLDFRMLSRAGMPVLASLEITPGERRAFTLGGTRLTAGAGREEIPVGAGIRFHLMLPFNGYLHVLSVDHSGGQETFYSLDGILGTERRSFTEGALVLPSLEVPALRIGGGRGLSSVVVILTREPPPDYWPSEEPRLVVVSVPTPTVQRFLAWLRTMPDADRGVTVLTFKITEPGPRRKPRS